MQYEWINNVAEMSPDYAIIEFRNIFNEKIEPNSLPENLTNLTFGWDFNQKIEPNSLPENLTTLTFGRKFNQKIETNSLPENLTTLTFGWYFNQIIEPNSLPEKLTTLTFGRYFNQKIEPNSLPRNLSTLAFGSFFNQKIEIDFFPSNLTNIIFEWIYNIRINKNQIKMINSIPSYYNVKLFRYNIIENVDGPKWPIHVLKYKEREWSSEIYNVIDEYEHSMYDGNIIVLINKETHEPYSHEKSARK